MRSSIKHVDPCTGSLASPRLALSPSSSSTFKTVRELVFTTSAFCQHPKPTLLGRVPKPTKKGLVTSSRDVSPKQGTPTVGSGLISLPLYLVPLYFFFYSRRRNVAISAGRECIGVAGEAKMHRSNSGYDPRRRMTRLRSRFEVRSAASAGT